MKLYRGPFKNPLYNGFVLLWKKFVSYLNNDLLAAIFGSLVGTYALLVKE